MPRSKRSKVVSLTKAIPKTRVAKTELTQKIEEALDKYDHVYVFACDNMRNNFLKEVRHDWSHSRIFWGNNKVMGKAFGASPEDEYQANTHHLGKALVNDVGLLFTNESPEAVQTYFKNFTRLDYARAGVVATETVALAQGPVVRGPDSEPFPNNMETQLRALGMPTSLKNGVITLLQDYNICKADDTLNSQQCQLLKHFYHQQAEFKMVLKCHYSDGVFSRM
ncbi:mRNA turnover and ribosome assembly protein [Dimargaris cristalligena]|nr:mRNA turnover and ribosome assembly protein [Dimargaris cristalligena]